MVVAYNGTVRLFATNVSNSFLEPIQQIRKRLGEMRRWTWRVEFARTSMQDADGRPATSVDTRANIHPMVAYHC